MSRPLALCAPLVLALALPAQITKATVVLGANADIGCQGTINPPTLTGGVLGSAQVDLTYDSSKGLLTLVINNTSEVVKDEHNPLLTRLHGNVSHHLVEEISLVSQKGAGGAEPAWTLTVDADPTDNSGSLKAGCLGNYRWLLASPGPITGALANPAADKWSGDADSLVMGPMEVVLQFNGPGAASLTAGVIANSLPYGNPKRLGTMAVHLQAAGLDGAQSGWISSYRGCAGGLAIAGAPKIGTTIQFCASAGTGCHGCLLCSLYPGPTVIGNYVVPIGYPLLFVLGLPLFPNTHDLCFPLKIPDDPELIGLKLYFAMPTIDVGTIHNGVSPGFTLTIIG